MFGRNVQKIEKQKEKRIENKQKEKRLENRETKGEASRKQINRQKAGEWKDQRWDNSYYLWGFRAQYYYYNLLHSVITYYINSQIDCPIKNLVSTNPKR